MASASEHEQQLTVRPGEEELIRRLIDHQRFSFENSNIIGPSEKANALLQAHFPRQTIGGYLLTDQKEVVLKYAKRLVKAMVDVISSNGWLSLSLLAMEVSQMLARGMWERDSVFLQLPHFTKKLDRSCQEKNIETIFDLLEMEDDERRELLQMSDLELMDVARFCNSYPSIDLSYDVVSGDYVACGEKVHVEVSLERDVRGRGEVEEGEGWWVVVGESETNQLLAIKRVSLQRKLKVKVEFDAPSEGGKKKYTLCFMCDSYLGCDQEYSFDVDVI